MADYSSGPNRPLAPVDLHRIGQGRDDGGGFLLHQVHDVDGVPPRHHGQGSRAVVPSTCMTSQRGVSCIRPPGNATRPRIMSHGTQPATS
ncbi:hypothetical protein, partial [Amycolatopsis pithecellobii]|uniref:hypothetical protein n=1 Tax=Amycolatopsis pithecellobii TaxID=664692 RepID=UPI001AA0335C